MDDGCDALVVVQRVLDGVGWKRATRGGRVELCHLGVGGPVEKPRQPGGAAMESDGGVGCKGRRVDLCRGGNWGIWGICC